jgi:hypothetical protein
MVNSLFLKVHEMVGMPGLCDQYLQSRLTGMTTRDSIKITSYFVHSGKLPIVVFPAFNNRAGELAEAGRYDEACSRE